MVSGGGTVVLAVVVDVGREGTLKSKYQTSQQTNKSLNEAYIPGIIHHAGRIIPGTLGYCINTYEDPMVLTFFTSRLKRD